MLGSAVFGAVSVVALQPSEHLLLLWRRSWQDFVGRLGVTIDRHWHSELFDSDCAEEPSVDKLASQRA